MTAVKELRDLLGCLQHFNHSSKGTGKTVCVRSVVIVIGCLKRIGNYYLSAKEKELLIVAIQLLFL